MPSTAQTHPCHRDGIDHSASAPPVEIPRDHVGEFVIPELLGGPQTLMIIGGAMGPRSLVGRAGIEPATKGL